MVEQALLSAPHDPTEFFTSGWVDSQIWARLELRHGDVVVATYPRSGTTWMQQILATLLHPGRGDSDLGVFSPWVESPRPETVRLMHIDRLASPRILKSHMPFNGLRYRAEARYVCVLRDGRDVARSHYDLFHLGWLRRNATSEEPILEPDAYFREWLSGGRALLPYFDHVSSWWAQRGQPNVLLVHYADLKRDLAGQMEVLAEFLEHPLSRLEIARRAESCSFAHMKANAGSLLAMQERAIPGASRGMINVGESGRWNGWISPLEADRYEEMALKALGPAASEWLANGSGQPTSA